MGEGKTPARQIWARRGHGSTGMDRGTGGETVASVGSQWGDCGGRVGGGWGHRRSGAANMGEMGSKVNNDGEIMIQ